ncbi:MAG: caspase family protein [Myxococcales bacterium]|nr:caspase family protein [Myxococcales bacterium]
MRAQSVLSPRRRILRTLLVAAALLLASGQTQPAGAAAEGDDSPLVFAVVVGHNDGWGLLPKLRYADDDALRFYRLALELAPRQNVALLTELDVDTWKRLQLSGTPPPPFLPPTKSKLLKVLELFKKRVASERASHPKRPVHLLFFFSGHGEKGYFFLKRPPSGSRRDAAFTGDDLRHAFAGSLATLNGLFIDACKSQSLFVKKGGAPEDAELGPDFSGLIKKVDHAAARAPLGVLTSTVSDRPAGEAEDVRGGYFSHVLTSGLSGAADANSDGLVRYGELAAFVSFHTRRISGQRPWFRPPSGKLTTTLVNLRGRRNLIEIPPGVGGHFVVFDDKLGNLRLEVHKTEAQWTRLLVPPGKYRVVWVKSRGAGLSASTTITRHSSARLLRKDFVTPVPLGQMRIPKGEGLGAPASAPTPLGLALAAFDPGRSGFDQPFTPRVVSTLADAYSSGVSQARESLVTTQRAAAPAGPPRNRLALGYTLLSSPTSPQLPGHGVAFGYGRRVWRQLEVGARAIYAASTDHLAANTQLPFDMHRIVLQAEASYSLALGVDWLRIEAGAYIGWQLVMVTRKVKTACDEGNCEATALAGDPRGFRAGAFAMLRGRVLSNLWLGAGGGFGVDLVHQQDADGARRAEVFARPSFNVQVSYGF